MPSAMPQPSDMLRRALDDAHRQANVCQRTCRLASKVNESTFEVFHNGIGASDSDHQVVWAAWADDFWMHPLVPLLTRWITGLHGGRRVDLNAEKPTP